jgi:hypothetical protein
VIGRRGWEKARAVHKKDLLYGANEHGKPNSQQEIKFSAGLIGNLDAIPSHVLAAVYV